MKNSRTRYVFIGLLMLTSLCSYAFLSHVSFHQNETAQLYQEKIEQNLEENVEEQEVFLPDVQIIKKALAAGKKIWSFTSTIK